MELARLADVLQPDNPADLDDLAQSIQLIQFLEEGGDGGVGPPAAGRPEI